MILRSLAICYYLITLAVTVIAKSSQEPLLEAPPSRYKLGDSIPVTCLNRTAEGEHMTDASGQLQYIPFPICNETKRPLELLFGTEKDINCTIDFISDAFFHQIEYVIHEDSPWTCRIPTRPLSALAEKSEGQGALSSPASYIPLIIALTGTLQLSHLHVSTHLNVLVHAAPKSAEPGVIQAATAYSISTPALAPERIIIGDSLPLRFSVRWYPTTNLPSGWQGVGGHIYGTTLVYCLLSAGAAVAVCFAYFRGVELPRRLRSHGRERMSGMEVGNNNMNNNNNNNRLGGWGYGINTSSSMGKRD